MTSRGDATHAGSPQGDSDAALGLIARFEEQLLFGCQSVDCKEVLCYTGRLNTTRRPIRRYTARSARAIAMAVCAGPRPRSHLCRYSESMKTQGKKPSTEPRDPSALIQLVSDTHAVSSLTSKQRHESGQLRSQHQILDHVIHEVSTSRACGSLMPAHDLMDKLLPCIDFLLALIPSPRRGVWEMADVEVVGKGYACSTKYEKKPADDKRDAWIVVLDFLDNEGYQRLLQRTIFAIGRGLGGLPSIDVDEQHGFFEEVTVRLTERIGNHPCSTVGFVVWLKSMFARVWNGAAIVARGSVAHVTLEILRQLRSVDAPMPRGAFKMPFICSRMAEMDLASSWRHARSNSGKHILTYQYAFSPDQLNLCFRSVNLVRMSKANAEVAKTCDYRRRHSIGRNAEVSRHLAQLQYKQEHYLLLYVSRENILRDTLDQLWQRRISELRRPLRVRMGADELDIGHDLGGVQVEFFNIVCKQAFSEEAHMFTIDNQTGLSYFRVGSLQPLYMFELLGLLLALAVYNGITLPIRLPLVFYQVLCGQDLEAVYHEDPLDTVQDAWPAMTRSLRSLRSEFVEDLEFVLPMEANGARLSCLGVANVPGQTEDARVELKVINAVATTPGPSNTSISLEPIKCAWPGWIFKESREEPELVTPENLERYIKQYSRWLCYDSVRPQLEAFIRGFRSSDILDLHTLAILGPTHLKAYVEGIDVLNIADLRSATRYDGYDAKQKYIQAFWRIVTAWPQAKQKLLLKFVTAAERIPIGGASHLTFIIKKAQPENLDALPTSSTCFGTLLLPRYPNADILAEKLNIALMFGAEGFGTG